MASIPQIVAAVEALSGEHVAVGISGYGGSGKSTLARSLAASVPSSARIRGDDFLDPTRSHTRSEDWDGMERMRLRAEVLEPFRAGRSGSFRRGKLRDRDLGRDHDALWDEAWVPTERAFAERYGPRERAHLRFDN
jgi:hypothetical protein